MEGQKATPKKQVQKNTMITMNEDLKQWVSAEEQANISKTVHERLKDKKSKGKCDICRVHPAKSVCIKCGNSVCSSCYFTMVGLCQNCLSKETIEKWKNKKTDWKKILEVDWVD
ncbi:MAG TPA: hypothetical protein DSN98_05485 [Thermoplasmata archaeon]|jgi:hypothetical protein|nr:MAG TPA: hypothetical protein DSN98_05485 [Thermoplasmata archaeon]